MLYITFSDSKKNAFPKFISKFATLYACILDKDNVLVTLHDDHGHLVVQLGHVILSDTIAMKYGILHLKVTYI